MLEKIDLIIERTGASYSKAKEALETNNYDVVEAIIAIEKENSPSESTGSTTNETIDAMKQKGKGILKTALSIIQKALVFEVAWKKNDQVYLQLPLLIVIIAALWLMPFSIIVLAAPFFFGVKTVIKIKSGTETDVATWIKNKTQ